MRYRVTSGHYVESGISFKITDDWLRAGNAHRALKESWVGQTCISEIPTMSRRPWRRDVAASLRLVLCGLVLLHFFGQFVCYPSDSVNQFPYPQCHFGKTMFPIATLRKIYFIESRRVQMVSGIVFGMCGRYITRSSTTSLWRVLPQPPPRG
jgi:hypothetical protein